MSRIVFGVALGAVAALVGLFACSSGTGGGASSCLAGALGSDCLSCIQDRCGSQLTGFNSACSDYLSCACPAGDNFSCSAAMSSACEQKSKGSGCTTALTSIDTCMQQSCETQCSGGGAECDGDAATTSFCTGSASSDGGACTNGQLLSYCTITIGSTTSCYYMIGSQQFACSSCTDTTSCGQAANTACY
jgi:hypothetical protein